MNPTLIIPIDHRIELLPFHLTYYLRQGWRRFVYALWNGEKNECCAGIREWWSKLAPADAQMWIRTSIECEYNQYNGPAEKDGLNRIRQEFVQPDDWYAVVDLDEFYLFMLPPDATLLGSIDAISVLSATELRLMLAIVKNYDAVKGYFHDRVTADGSFPPIPEFGHRTLDKTFPIDVYLTRNAHYANINKITLARGWCEIYGGHHRTSDGARILENAVEVHHFKWSNQVIDLLWRRFQAYSSQGLNWAPESLWFLKFFAANRDWVNHPMLRAREAKLIGV